MPVTSMFDGYGEAVPEVTVGAPEGIRMAVAFEKSCVRGCGLGVVGESFPLQLAPNTARAIITPS
jgi:hypothetical protein